MTAHSIDFNEFSDEAFRISSNLAQAYEGLFEAKAALSSLPAYMTWKTVSGTKYLYQAVDGVEKSLGRESDETIKAHDAFRTRQHDAKESVKLIDERLSQLAAQYRALRLPQIMSMPSRLLSALDAHNLLWNGSNDGAAFIVVGSAAFPAYEIEAGGKFLQGLDETEDFDLSWSATVPALTAGELHLSSTASEPVAVTKKSLCSIAAEVDKTFALSAFSGHKLRNKGAFYIDVLCRTGDYFKSEVAERQRLFGEVSPLELPGQDILHLGTKLRHICIGRNGTVAPLVVPDPRCMSIHKRWLSMQPDRNPQKRRKDEKQAIALFDACDKHMPRFRFDADFLDSLPEKWRTIASEMLAEITPSPMPVN